MGTELSTVTRRWWRPVAARLAGAVSGEAGMSTAEYATVCLATRWSRA